MSKFIDHYSILNVSVNASVTEIITAYKRQCFKWHPDRNPGVEATNRMQDINEAKRILSNSGLRETYNKEYRAYKDKSTNKNKNKGENSKGENTYQKANYSCHLKSDNELFRYCSNAAKYSFEYIHTVLQELKKRGYSLETINNTIKNKAKPTV
jgi:curved DNA-binding protein CbpA